MGPQGERGQLGPPGPPGQRGQPGLSGNQVCVKSLHHSAEINLRVGVLSPIPIEITQMINHGSQPLNRWF